MKISFKLVMCVVCASVLAFFSILETVAYLTDRDEAVNTFTVGTVDITLDETKVNEDGTAVEGADRVQSNEYHLIPGASYIKDPTVTVNPGSEESYVRMILTVHNASAVQALIDNNGLEDFSDLIGGWDSEVWCFEGFEFDEENNTIAFEFRYHETVSTGDAELVLPALFDTLIVPETASSEELQALYDGGFRMVINGHAIQSYGLVTADAAWAAFDAQNTNNQ